MDASGYARRMGGWLPMRLSQDERTTMIPVGVEGAESVVRWFGSWPTFHDAEVLTITLDRSFGCRILVYVYERTSRLDASGTYVTTKPAHLTFELEGFSFDDEGIVDTRIEFFNHQNVLSGISIDYDSNACLFTLEGIFGVSARIACKRARVSIVPLRTPASCQGVHPSLEHDGLRD